MKGSKTVPPYKDGEDFREWKKWAEKTRRNPQKRPTFPKKC